MDYLRRAGRRHLVIGLASLGAVFLFTGLAAISGWSGFPLDDAWIHQTYARNFVASGRWEYTPGVTSAGSTAPLWTLLIAVGYLLRLPFLVWTYLLGGVALATLAGAGARLWCILYPQRTQMSLMAGLALVLTWPLIWAAASGMETLLFASLGLWILVIYLERLRWPMLRARNAIVEAEKTRTAGDAKTWMLLGALSGFLILIRPDGVILLFLVCLGLCVEQRSWSGRLAAPATLLATAFLPLLPYLLFNLWASGNLWPNTFYAKQAEYSTLLAEPFLSRLFRLQFFSLGGPEIGWRGSSAAHLFLLPGLVVMTWHAFSRDWGYKRVRLLLPLLWAGGHVFLYAWRLPVTYQHGRYLLPATPVWVIYGLAGWLSLFSFGRDSRAIQLAQRVAGLSFVVLLLVFLLLGARSYSTDVAFIEGEMVSVARWLSERTPADALIAAHDIGAIGYFAERPLLDLAGLLSPEIIPLLSDEAALGRHILASDADYLVTAPGWPYEEIIEQSAAMLLFTSNFAWTREQGVNNMAVYQLTVP